ncbi:MAG: hypothetical protein AAF570_11940 [Bacteroidota bacterium]
MPILAGLFWLIGIGSAKSQLKVGLGYQQGFFNMPNANLPVERFNDRGFLFKNMPKMRFPGGEIYSAAYRHDRLLLELTLNTRRARVSAESFDGAILMRRDVRFSVQAFSLGFGYGFVDEEGFALYVCGAIDVGRMSFLSRLGQKETVGRVPYQLFSRSTHTGLGANVRFLWRESKDALITFSLSPYIQYALLTHDFIRMHQLLNPADWHLDGSTFPGRPTNFGVMFQVDIDLLRFLE